MKTFVTAFALTLALCAAVGATARTGSVGSVSAPDSVLLSETTDGDYLVRRYKIHRSDDNGYSLNYQINTAKLVSTLDDNSQELAGINGFVENLMNDTLMHVKSVQIIGYSSPDGPLKLNETLAEKRAIDFKNYVDRKYGFSKKFKVTTRAVADDWEMSRSLVNESNIPDKQAVLQVIDGSGTSAAKEQKLKRMPAAWNYMKANILPQLRRVELMIDYDADIIVEQRTLIPKPKPAFVEPCEQPVPCMVVDESITGLIVAMPESDADYRKDFWAVEKIARKEAKAARKAEKAAMKAAKEAEKAGW